MRLEKFVLIVVCVIAGLMAAVYFVGLLIGTVVSYGLMLPILGIFVAAAVVVWIVIRQRLENAEDDHYDNIRR